MAAKGEYIACVKCKQQTNTRLDVYSSQWRFRLSWPSQSNSSRSSSVTTRIPLPYLTSFAPSIHHPFLLSDNRHYTFYVWKRIFCLHPIMPYLFIPGYIACGWAWFLRAGEPSYQSLHKNETLIDTICQPKIRPSSRPLYCLYLSCLPSCPHRC